MTDQWWPNPDDPPPPATHPAATRTCGCPPCTTWRTWVARNLTYLKEHPR